MLPAMRALPAILSSLLLAAHFLRDGRLAVVLVCLVSPLLLAGAAAWRRRVYQVFLALGALEWLRTGVGLGMDRIAAGEPWVRMAFILGGVAAFTAWSAWLAGPRPPGPEGEAPGAAT